MKYSIILLVTAAALSWNPVRAEKGAMTGALPEPGAAGPEHVSRNFIGRADVKGGRLDFEIPVDTPSGAKVVLLGEHPTRVDVQGRAGDMRTFRSRDLGTMDVPDVGAATELGRARAGRVRVEALVPNGARSVPYVVTQPDSPLALETRVRPLAARAGEMVHVTADLSSGDPARARVHGEVAGIGTVRFRDDGRGGDAIAGDNRFTARFPAPQVASREQTGIRIDARGRIDGERPFARTARAAVMVSNPTLNLRRGHVRADREGLTVRLPPERGRYRIEAIYGRDGRAAAFSRETVELDGRREAVHLPRPAEAGRSDRATVRVLNADTLALEGEFRVRVPATPSVFFPMEGSRPGPAGTRESPRPEKPRRADSP